MSISLDDLRNGVQALSSVYYCQFINGYGDLMADKSATGVSTVVVVV